MKKILNKIIILTLAVMALNCEEPDNVIYDVFDKTTRGAVLRTMSITSPAFDVLDLNSFFEVIIEEQDLEDGNLLSKVEVFVSSANGTEALVNTIPASEFATDSNGLPGAKVKVVLQDALTSLNLPAADIQCGDFMNVRLKVHLTDGRTFTDTDASGSLQGSFFKSPYIYRVNIVANLPSETLYTGQYQLETLTPGIFGVADYQDGTYTIEAISSTIRVIKGVTTFPAFGGFGPVDLQFEFICGEIVLTNGQSVGAGCNVAIVSGEAETHTTYDLNNPDDSSLIINFTSDVTADCATPTQASFKLTKI